MEMIETLEKKPGSRVLKTDWLQSAISGVDEKTKAILNVLEDYDSPMQNAEVYERRKDKITEMIKDLCISYHSLAEEYDHLRTVTSDAHISESSSPSDDRSTKDVDSNPESTVEDVDIERSNTTPELESIQRWSDNLIPKDGSSIRPVSALSDEMATKFSKLVEENTQIQVELIRRNSEKRETIRKLQNQVSKLRDENKTLHRTLSYFDRNKQNLRDDSPRRKAMILEKFFQCSP